MHGVVYSAAAVSTARCGPTLRNNAVLLLAVAEPTIGRQRRLHQQHQHNGVQQRGCCCTLHLHHQYPFTPPPWPPLVPWQQQQQQRQQYRAFSSGRSSSKDSDDSSGTGPSNRTIPNQWSIPQRAPRSQRERADGKKRNDHRKDKSAKPSYRFVDIIRVRAEGGMGGKGCLSLEPVGHKRKLRPDGGSGGNGGSVVLVADPVEQTLDWSHPHLKAKSGSHGTSQDRFGKNGPNRIVRVPCGVVVRRILDDDEEYDPTTQSVIKNKSESTTTTLSGPSSTVDYSEQEGYDDHDDEYGDSDNDDDDDDLELDEDDLAAIERLKQGYEIEVGPRSAFSVDNNDDDDDDDDNNNLLLADYWSNIRDDDDADRPKITNRRKVVLADLDEPGSHYVVAKGGRGGLGTSVYASRHGPLPDAKLLVKNSQPHPGEVAFLELELKLIADIGLVGFPNAGKSSLLRAMSRASPEVAPYPFTTLHPMIGCIDYRDGVRVRAADIPGLIDGASTGRGKGHDFLRHIERTKALLYIVDAAGVDERDPVNDLRVLIQELGSYGDGSLLQRRALVVANKIDLLTKPKLQQVMVSVRKAMEDLGIICDQDVIGISAGVSGEGLGVLAKAIRDVVKQSEDDKLSILSAGPDQLQHHYHGS